MNTDFIDLRQLQAFQAVARTNSFTQAARELYLTQSAISHSIKALEDDLGCSLFIRVGKKMRISQAGEVLLEHTNAIFASLHQAREAVTNLSAWGRGRFRIGASVTICHYILTSVIREFRECFPEADLVIEPLETYDSHAALIENRIDLAISLPPEDNDLLKFSPLFTDELLFIYSPSHPAVKSGKLSRAALHNAKFFLLSKRNATYALIKNHLKRERMELPKIMELGSVEAVKDLLRLGMGIGILPTWTVKDELANATLLSLTPSRHKLIRQWGITTLKTFRTNLMAETFIGLCQSASRYLNQDTQ